MLIHILHYLKSLRKTKNKGQGMVDYGLVIALIALSVVVALIFLGPKLATLYTVIADSLPSGVINDPISGEPIISEPQPSIGPGCSAEAAEGY